MAKNTNNKEALAAVNAIQSFDFESVGITLPKVSATTARNSLVKNSGVAKSCADSLSDNAALLVHSATASMDKASLSLKSAALNLGVLSYTNQWKAAKAPDGKPYKSENAFLRDVFPGYAVSTTSLYADVGKSIYIPILQHTEGYEGLEFLLELSPANAKFLLATVKDDDKRALLPSAYAEATKDSKLNQRKIQAMAKSIKDKLDMVGSELAPEDSNVKPDETAMPTNEQEAAEIQAQLQGSLNFDKQPTTEAKVRLAFQAAKNDSNEIAALIPEQYTTAFIALLTKGAGDANVALTICSELCKIITNAAANK